MPRMPGPGTARLLALSLAAAGLGALAPVAAQATNASNELNLVGGDRLQANAFHCTTYLRQCSWETSAKLLGDNPKNASWIQNAAELKAHGPSAKITLGKSSNVEITFKSKSLVKTRWRNTKTWISSSGGKVKPSLSTAYVSTRASATAKHPKFGTPGPVTAYAGAL